MHTPIPEAELDVFKQLGDMQVIFDVGARTDTVYLSLVPGAEFHLFEVNPVFFEELKKNVGDTPNVYLNNFGLGDVEGDFFYNSNSQALSGGAIEFEVANGMLPVKRLDDYAQDKQIDFLKIDTEGYDYKVLVGGQNTLSKVRFIQYEHWDDKQIFHTLLEKQFDMVYIGYRNVLCMNKKLVPKKTRTKIQKYIEDKKYALLS